MIDIKKAKKELENYVKEKKLQNLQAQKKLEHIMRVGNLTKEIATTLELTEEHIQLAELIGILHDIGRFEQYEKYNQKVNLGEETKKFNHGEAVENTYQKMNMMILYIQPFMSIIDMN